MTAEATAPYRASQHVGSDAQELHPQVDADQVRTRRSQADGQGGENQKRVELAPIARPVLQVGNSRQDDEHHTTDGNDLEKQGVRVDGHQRQDGGRGRAHEQQGADQRRGQADKGQGRHPERLPAPRRAFSRLLLPPDKVHAQDHQPGKQQDQLG